jgi:beta-galactosidase
MPPAPVSPNQPAELYVFPHWDWVGTGISNVDVWVYSNADEVELFVNGATAGRKNMTQYSHAEWDAVPYVPGSIRAVAYTGGVQVAEMWRNTTGPAAALQISVKDGFGTALVAGCADVALVQVAIVDAAGLVINAAAQNVTFAVSGPATLGGTGNGDPACHTPDKSATRPAYHGWVMAVIQGGDAEGTVTVTASSPGFMPVSVSIPQAAPAPGFEARWCHLEPQL